MQRFARLHFYSPKFNFYLPRPSGRGMINNRLALAENIQREHYPLRVFSAKANEFFIYPRPKCRGQFE